MIQSFQTSSITSKQIKMKLIFLGNMGVGKSSIIQRYTKNTYHSDQTPTVGIDILERVVACNSHSYKLSLWDTAGQQKFLSMVSSYLKMGQFCIVVFDVTNRKSFQQLPKWINMYQQHGSQQSKIAIMGNKTDLPRKVTKDEAKAFAAKLGYPYYQNIQNAFSLLVRSWGSETKLLQSLPSIASSGGYASSSTIPSKKSIESNDSTKPVKIDGSRKDWNSQRGQCCHI